MKNLNLGIIGSGKLAVTLAPLALKTSFPVKIAGSGDPSSIQLTVKTLTPGAEADWTKQVAQWADIIILALPLSRIIQLNPTDFADKLVIDAMNYWPEIDGQRSDLLPKTQSSSEWVQELLKSSRVTKALSHMSYHDLHDEAAPAGATGRKAIAIASDHQADIATVSQLINQLGFDPVQIGPLSSGYKLEPGNPAFGADLEKDELIKLINSY